MFKVVVTEKGGSKQRLEFAKDDALIGRVHGNDVVLPRGNVSKQHAKVALVDGAFTVTDLESTNGTYVNGRRIFNPQTITPKDKIYVGDFIINVEASGPPATPPKRDTADTEKNPVMTTGDTGTDSRPPPPLPTIPDEAKGERRSRPSVPQPAPRISEKPYEKRVPLPGASVPPPREKPKAKAKAPSVSKAPPAPKQKKTPITALTPPVESPLQLETLRARVLEILGRPPAKGVLKNVDVKSAGQVRGAVHGVVTAHVADHIEDAANARAMKGALFRQLIDMGSLGNWLEDSRVSAIRISDTQVASLRTDGKWIEVRPGFEDRAELEKIVSYLGAGVETVQSAASDTIRYISDDGYHVFVTSDGGASSVIIDKTVALGLSGDISETIDQSGLSVLQGAIDSDAKIAVLGKRPLARQLMFYQLLSLLPDASFTVTVEPFPIPLSDRRRCLQLSSTSSDDLSGLLDQGASLEPDWLALGGVSARQVPDVLAAAAGRLSLIADLPLSALGAIDKELATVMTSAGVSVTATTAAALLDASFDIIVVADRSRAGAVYLRRVLASGVDDNGDWAPKVLHSVEKTR